MSGPRSCPYHVTEIGEPDPTARLFTGRLQSLFIWERSCLVEWAEDHGAIRANTKCTSPQKLYYCIILLHEQQRALH